MKKEVFILILFLVVFTSGIGIVSAETLTGSLGGMNFTQTAIGTGGSTLANIPYVSMIAKDIASTGVPTSVIQWMWTGKRIVTDAGSPNGVSIPCTFYIYDGSLNATTFLPVNGYTTLLGTGTIGYQKVFNSGSPPVEQDGGYAYVVFNTDWDIGGLTGDQYIYIDYNRSDFYHAAFNAYGADISRPAGTIGFNYNGFKAPWSTSMLYTKDNSIYATYTLTKPSGLGITGNITKTYPYRSQGFFFDDIGVIISADSSISNTTTSLNTVEDRVMVGIRSSGGVYYNSSLLFSSGTGTPTPTPTPTPTVTLLPGQFWTTFAAQDATTGGLIPGAEIDIYSRFTGTWNNATTSTGERTIATSSDNYYDVDGNASGYSNGTLTNVMAYNNAYYLVNLFPTTGLPSVPGQVNLFVSVTERETGLPISGASVSVATPGSWTVQGETDDKGIEIFSTSNSSVKYITVSKTGYKAETRTITTPASGNYNAVLQMSRMVVTTVPTGYIPPGSVTPVTTMDSRSTTEKDQDMMNMIRDSGPQLIQLAIAVTMISLLGLMTKGFGK